ncbi:acyl-CoA dehydrogenase family protein [Turneriella parva]|uniref:Acyl-CoA dehydrogenase domain-containing protein n=1 Tax=Turneriella parva (strain ATCC BAA-1111 / DSM 21527 / NCTC 11395 / H) TaxID=869212 RepID=I4BBB0_TURPD|nr:acyl-CoA dehydrogenase family protein [Turneriella parva]AFM14567.1 acyl-CoA dehydrogenase domain-containing protein [Turneriella parva DSM 21527]
MFDIFNPTDDHKALRELTHDLAKGVIEPQVKEYDEKEILNESLLRKLGSEYSLYGITIPAEAGGHGLDATASVIVHEELSYSDAAFTLSYLAHEVLFVNNLYHSADAKIREKYIPPVLDGTAIAGMAMSEPGAGTDVLGMTTFAERKGDRYILNGTKQWITNGNCGSYFLVYAKTDKNNRQALSSFLVDKNFKGFSVGKKEIKLGMKQSPTCQLVFEDVEVPTENLIGAEHGALTHMMRNLEIERLTLAAMSLGIARRALDEMVRYAVVDRSAFGKKLSEFGQIQQLIAESYARYRASRAFVYETALRVNPNSRESLSAAAAKLSATQMAEYVARAAIQVLGGYGYTREYPVEKLLRDAILLSIGGGTNEAMQKNIMKDLALSLR